MRCLRLIPLLLLSCLTACFEEAADLTNPKVYDSNQIFFKYPANWEISQDTYTPAVHNLFVETPGDALVIFQSFPANLANDLKIFSKEFSESMQEQTPIGKISNSDLKSIPKEGGFEWIEEEFEISILGESIPHKRIYGSKKIANRQIILIFQSATEDYPKAVPGFQLIRDTLEKSEK